MGLGVLNTIWKYLPKYRVIYYDYNYCKVVQWDTEV